MPLYISSLLFGFRGPPGMLGGHRQVVQHEHSDHNEGGAGPGAHLSGKDVVVRSMGQLASTTTLVTGWTTQPGYDHARDDH